MGKETISSSPQVDFFLARPEIFFNNNYSKYLNSLINYLIFLNKKQNYYLSCVKLLFLDFFFPM